MVVDPVIFALDNSSQSLAGPKASAIVEGCLESVILKVAMEPAWAVAGSEFLKRVLPAVCDAAAQLLQAAHARHEALKVECSLLEAWMARSEERLEDLRLKTEREVWLPRRQMAMIRADLARAEERASKLESRLAVATDRRDRLRLESDASCGVEREAWSKQRALLQGKLEELVQEEGTLRSHFFQRQRLLQQRQAENSITRRAVDDAKIEASYVPQSESQWREVQEQVAELSKQLREAQMTPKQRKALALARERSAAASEAAAKDKASAEA